MTDNHIPLRHCITDITDVSGAKSYERQNTITLTKKTEIRSKTLLSFLAGVVIGVLLLICTYWIIDFISFVFPVIGGILSVYFFGQTKDGKGITRWKRLNDRRKSRGMHGKLFFPNSQQPVNLNKTKLIIINNTKQ